jgi:signal transduction histidine kinase
MASTYAADDVLPRMARILAEGTGAKEARVWLKVADELTPAAAWPDAQGNGSSPRLDGADLLVPVTHQNEELGALSITKAPGERLTPAEEKLTTDLASQAGLVLRNVRLIEDLKASRIRLVQAQDSERRRIERNIHDGAQQQLVALQVKLGLALRLSAEPEQLDPILTQLQEDTNQALQDLRDLARGIYPPLLADQGLAAALGAQARKSPLPVAVEADGIGRYPQDAEAAVYFCVLEALQNVAKYAQANSATVKLSATEGQLSFEVTDDGQGFDASSISYGTGLQGMADRLAALGGRIDVHSQPGAGTTVTGWLPVKDMEPVL